MERQTDSGGRRAGRHVFSGAYVGADGEIIENGD